ncbi:hypothetical protein MTR_0046s0080 [Medicago truncatula]|uniref:Retrotransposon gag domain-containing protein n=1 Tax=Medicago truncatula TaxID=3880 RepID=A0A072TJL1_MEDTR|nr:hypothetical protein MTR_0046s0080 [Medicago truncatula]
MGQSKISLKELASVRRKTHESIDDYLNRFQLLKARCFTSVPEHVLVEMVAGGLDYSVRKKLDAQYLRDMAQLADRSSKLKDLRLKRPEQIGSLRKKKLLISILEIKALDEGRLKFGEKSKTSTKSDVESSKKANSMYAEVIGINMVDVAESSDSKLPLEKVLLNDVEMVTEDHVPNNNMVTEDQFNENVKGAYPKDEEDLVDFLNRCKISNTNAMLCPRCSAVFDKEAAKAIEGFQPQTTQRQMERQSL